MGQGSEEDVAVHTPRITFIYGFFTILHIVMTDLIFYGCMIPLFGTYLGGLCANMLHLGPKWELLLIILFSFSMIYGTITIVGEDSYWKHLFAFERFYCTLLQIRDLFNCALLILCVTGIASTIEAMANQDKGMKSVYVSEGVLYIFLKTFCQYLHVDESFMYNLGITAPHSGELADPNFGESEKYEHGAVFMMYFAVMTGCVSKLAYFNTLFTYMRALQIFQSMKPTFEDDDEWSESSVSITSKTRINRMENNFVRGVMTRPAVDETTS